ncbi:MAG: hypothetical protein H0W08_05575 [Acidobacteria bacterium]|nr:hypothetical protein [Acidobacteriota bacterium]
MNHLSDVQFTAALEDELDPAGSAHLDACGACAAKVRGLRTVLASVLHAPVAEPSPLFWEHFGARVNKAIDSAQPPAAASWGWTANRGWLAAAAIVPLVMMIGALALYVIRSGADERSRPAPRTAAAEKPLDAGLPAGRAPAAVDTSDLAGDPPDDDRAWALMRSLAIDLHYDDAREAGILPRPGAIETAATELSALERAELVRLLQDELKRTGA